MSIPIAQRTIGQLIPEAAIIGTNSQRPDDIINQLDRLAQQQPGRPVLCVNGDVWRYRDDPRLMAYFRDDDRVFYIHTQGYRSEKLLDNLYLLSFPLHYFRRRQSDDLRRAGGKIRNFGFSCLNNRPAFHRLVLGQSLFGRNLLQSMVWTQHLTDFWPQGNYTAMLADLPFTEEYKKHLPMKWTIDKTIDPIRDQGSMEEAFNTDHDAYQSAYCNIPTESEIEDFIYEGPIQNLEITTEKSWKPFLSGQVPLWFAAKGHMAYLKSLGFETMDDLLPADYDTQGTFDKVSTIVDIVSKGRDYIESFYFDHVRERQHNFELINSDRVEQKLMSDLKTFLDSVR